MGLRARLAICCIGCLLAARLLASCAVADLDLAGKHCPCADGYVCDPQTDTCVFPASGDDGGRQLDGAVGDANADAPGQGDTGSKDGSTPDARAEDGNAGDSGGTDATADVASDAATFACGPMNCLTTEWCDIVTYVSLDGGGFHTNYSCNPLPGGCEPTPTCPCLGKQNPPCMCTSQNNELTVNCGM
jgi:hypothetical protein